MMIRQLHKIAAFVLFSSIFAAGHAQPVINSVTSTYSTIGSIVTLTGSGFSAVPGENLVKFGSIRANVVSATPTELKVTVPVTGKDARISVINTATGQMGMSKHQFSNRYCVTSYPSFNYGSLHTTPAYTGMKNPNGVDVDGDGIMDIVSGNLVSAEFTVQRGNATTIVSMNPHIAISSATILDAHNTLIVADLDNDGLEDVIGAAASGTFLFVHRNLSTPGNVSFAPMINIPLPGLGGPMAVADFDSDGKLDIAVGSPSTNLFILRNTTSGAISFAPAVTYALGSNPLDVLAVDIDNNNIADVTVASTIGAAFLNNSTPGAISMTSSPLSFLAGKDQLDAVDMDLDGAVDILARNGTTGLEVYRSTGSAGAPMYATAVQVHPGASIGAADLTGDGKAEPFYTMDFGWICTNENLSSPGNCQWGGQRDYTCSGQGSRFFRGDFNGDGLEDFGNMATNGQMNIVSANADAITGLNITAIGGCQPNSGTATVASIVSAGGVANVTYAWSSSSSTTATATGLAPGVHTVTVTSAAACTFVADFIIEAGSPVTAQVNVTQPQCANDLGSATVNATGGTSYTYNWSGGQSTATVTLAPGTYTVTVTNESNCTDVETIVINQGNGTPVNAGADLTVCQGESVTLSGSGGTSYFWSNGVTNGVPFTANATNFYVLSGLGASCPGTDTVWVMVNPLPSTQFTATPNLLTVQFTDQTPGAVTHAWNFGDNGTSTLANPSHIYANPGAYQVCLTTTNADGCSKTVCETISVTATGTTAPVGFHFSVAPNPVSDMLHVSIDHPAGSVLNLRVMDATGKVLAATPFSGNAAEVNVASLAPGVYILELADGDLAVRTRFVKQD